MYVGSLTCSDVGDASFYLEFIAVFDDTSSVNSVTSGVGDAEESVRKVASILEITTTVTLGESTVVNNDDIREGDVKDHRDEGISLCCEARICT